MLGDPGGYGELDTAQVLLAARKYPDDVCLHPLDGSPEMGRCQKCLAHTSGIMLTGILQVEMYATNLETILREPVRQKLHPER